MKYFRNLRLNLMLRFLIKKKRVCSPYTGICETIYGSVKNDFRTIWAVILIMGYILLATLRVIYLIKKTTNSVRFAGKSLFKVSKITLEQRPFILCSSVIFLTLRRFCSEWSDWLVLKTLQSKEAINFKNFKCGMVRLNPLRASIFGSS